jgi:hypothetical protein
MSTAPTACDCKHFVWIEACWNSLTRRQQSDIARDVDIVTQEPPRRDVYSVTSTKSLSSVDLIERVKSRWDNVPSEVRPLLEFRCQHHAASNVRRGGRIYSRNGNRR